MDDQRRRPDPTSRPDPYELAITRAAQEPGPEDGDGAPPLPRLHAGPFRVGPTGLLVGVLLLVGVGTLVRFGGDRTPGLPPSCSSFALALSAERVRPGGVVEYAVVGPDRPVTLEVLQRRGAGQPDGPRQPVPAPALQGCRAEGRFGAQVPPGDYVVTLSEDGVPVATQDLVVTEPGDPDVG